MLGWLWELLFRSWEEPEQQIHIPQAEIEDHEYHALDDEDYDQLRQKKDTGEHKEIEPETRKDRAIRQNLFHPWIDTYEDE